MIIDIRLNDFGYLVIMTNLRNLSRESKYLSELYEWPITLELTIYASP